MGFSLLSFSNQNLSSLIDYFLSALGSESVSYHATLGVNHRLTRH
jgi:hypothetical protein